MRALLAGCLLASMLASGAERERPRFDDSFLAALGEVSVRVRPMHPRLARAAGVEEGRLEELLRRRLEDEGIPVRAVGRPALLELHVSLAERKDRVWAYHVQLGLTQIVTLDQPAGMRVPATTWENSGLGVGGTESVGRTIEELTERLVSRFAEAVAASKGAKGKD